MKSDVCEYCYFYKSLFKESKGECHRFPPKIIKGGITYFSEFPKVYEYNWCGEFKAKLK